LKEKLVSEDTDTTWEIKPHTQAKHEILKRYLGAWFPILSTWERRLIYLDGFAGPGVYKGGEGSPVIALQTAVGHILAPRFKEIVFFFIEKDQKRAEILMEVLREKFPNLPENIKYFVKGNAEFAPTFENVLDALEKQGSKIAPTFAFLDPFGFSDLPIDLVGRLLKCDKCEVFITFMAGFIRRFLDDKRESALNQLFGNEEWKRCRGITDPEERLNFLVSLYEKQLRTIGGAKYVRSFGMIGEHNQIVYYLIYATKSLKGLEVMKDAMLKVDKSGSYKFSDITGNKQALLDDFQDEPSWVPNAANAVYQRFRGKTVSDVEIYQFIIAETPFPKRKAILQYLENSSPPKIIKVSRPQKSTRGFPDGCSITFSK
jgi:three-Cys-motif partner protein